MIKEREQTTLRLPKDLKEELEKLAEEQGYTLNSFLIAIINEFFNKER